jgi:hypothetical protein
MGCSVWLVLVRKCRTACAHGEDRTAELGKRTLSRGGAQAIAPEVGHWQRGIPLDDAGVWHGLNGCEISRNDLAASIYDARMMAGRVALRPNRSESGD